MYIAVHSRLPTHETNAQNGYESEIFVVMHHAGEKLNLKSAL